MTTAIDICEFETEPFTQSEHDAIRRYDQRIDGMPDCFDLSADAGVPPFPEEFTQDDKAGDIKAHFGMLGEWREAITALAEELAEAHTGPGLSGAATRYVGNELLRWRQALEGLRRGTVELFLGRDEYGYAFDHFAPRPEGWRHADGIYWING